MLLDAAAAHAEKKNEVFADAALPYLPVGPSSHRYWVLGDAHDPQQTKPRIRWPGQGVHNSQIPGGTPRLRGRATYCSVPVSRPKPCSGERDERLLRSGGAA